jgi:hypothetical protein
MSQSEKLDYFAISRNHNSDDDKRIADLRSDLESHIKAILEQSLIVMQITDCRAIFGNMDIRQRIL